MKSPVEVRKLLALCNPELPKQEGLLSSLKSEYDVHEVSNLESAVEALRVGRYDAVIAQTSDFLPLERAVSSQLSAAVLATIGEGVCVVGPEGELVWANRRLREFPEAVIREIVRLSGCAHRTLVDESTGGISRSKRYSLMPEDGSYYELICSAILDPQ
jgi:hypothetical protein